MLMQNFEIFIIEMVSVVKIFCIFGKFICMGLYPMKSKIEIVQKTKDVGYTTTLKLMQIMEKIRHLVIIHINVCIYI
jgi:CBS domain containing-hemolysin-like protein